DDRDAGVMETDRGTILVTSFTSLAYEPVNRWPKDEKSVLRWKAAHNRLTAEQRQKMLGAWMVRSTDGGATWSGRYNSTVNSPHGPIQLADGRQLYAGKEMGGEKHRVGACESTDDGQTWRWLAQIPTRKGDDPLKYHELHAVETADSRIVAQIRNHNNNNKGETLQTESSDGGKTWSEPHSIGVYGYPSHLLRLRDDRLLMTFGHRRKPYGNQARLSEDNGKTWSQPIIINGDAPGADMGYSSTVELDDGTLLSVWYEVMRGSKKAVLRQARWKLKG
ncbi:MAG: exo-alpha-sialidase, partial [Pirellulales bacterium]|nr:exo-alpha-sialidase [Pirellulales bacterium]